MLLLISTDRQTEITFNSLICLAQSGKLERFEINTLRFLEQCTMIRFFFHPKPMLCSFFYCVEHLFRLRVCTWTMSGCYLSVINYVIKWSQPSVYLCEFIETYLFTGNMPNVCRFICEGVAPWEPTSSLLAWFWMNLKPGMRFWVHTTPTSSECLQSETPKPLEWHWARLFSPPVQCRLSNQIWPERQRVKQIDICCVCCFVGLQDLF